MVPTLNAFDNGDTRATVLVLTEPILMRDREGKAGGGKGLLMSNTAFTLSANNFHTLFIPEKEVEVEENPIVFYGNRVDDIQVQGEVVNTLQARMGTGGGNMPLVGTQSIVRRLTPTECERLQGFPDDWTRFDTEGKERPDSHRYKEMGNAVCVNVVDFIVSRLVLAHEKTNYLDRR